MIENYLKEFRERYEKNGNNFQQTLLECYREYRPKYWDGLDQNDIETIVCNATKTDAKNLKNKTRNHEIVFSRHMVYYLTKLNIHGISWSKNGRRYAQNHATVYHGYNRIKNDIEIRNKHTIQIINEIGRNAEAQKIKLILM